MKTVILRTTDDRDVYINPEYVTSIYGSDTLNACNVYMVTGRCYEIIGHKHLVASILETERTSEDKFVSYKDWEWNDDDGHP